MTAQIVELVDVQVLAGQEVLNVFHFVDTTGALSIPTLVTDYAVHVLPLEQGLQSTAVSHTAIRYRTIYPTASLQLTASIVPSVDGVEAGDVLSSCTAMSGQWILGNPTVNLVGGTLPHIRKGGVRIAGPVESNVVGNSAVAGYATAWQTWFLGLAQPNGDGWKLCVVSYLNAARARMTTAQQYVIPTASSAPSPSTQNSRKVLRGRTR